MVVSRLRLHLASASPRRLQLLRQIGLDPIARPARVEENVLRGESPPELVRRLAELKGRTAASRIAPQSGDGALILAADTAVVLDGDVLGKPKDARQAWDMLQRLRGRTHEVLTGVFLLRTDDGRSVCEHETTRVTFCEYDDAIIRDYVAGGEPLDKAGAYGIQGRGALLARGLEGSWSNVVGLPVERLPRWLDRIGIDIWSGIVRNS
jgi:septum formation protein